MEDGMDKDVISAILGQAANVWQKAFFKGLK